MKNGQIPPSVAIVANSLDQARCMAKNLRPFGLNTVYVGDNTTDLSEVLGIHPDALLLSVHDTGMNGELLRQLLGAIGETSSEVKTIIRTSYREDTEVVKTALEMGASAVGDCKDWNRVAQVVHSAVEGKPISMCETSSMGHRLESSRAPGYK